MSKNEITSGEGGTTFAGPLAVNVYRATVIASALRLYAQTGMKANRAYTPSNMLAAATQITGKTYKRGHYLRAAFDLTEWAHEQARTIKTQQEG